MAQNETLTVKRVPFYLFLVLLGFLSFYVYDHIIKKERHGGGNPIPTTARPITKETADAYIINYLSSQDSLGDDYKLVTSDGKTTLRGFWISKESLKGMDASIRKIDKSANIVGYSVYFGKAEPFSKNKKQALTLIIRGTVPGKSKSGNTVQKIVTEGEEIEDEGDYYDHTDPCPQNCGEEEPIDSTYVRSK